MCFDNSSNVFVNYPYNTETCWCWDCKIFFSLFSMFYLHIYLLAQSFVYCEFNCKVLNISLKPKKKKQKKQTTTTTSFPRSRRRARIYPTTVHRCSSFKCCFFFCNKSIGQFFFNFLVAFFMHIIFTWAESN